MTGYRISDIAAALGAEALGADDIIVTGVAEPAAAGRDDLALAMAERYAADLAKGNARAAVIGPGMDWRALGLEAAIVAPRPRYALAGVTQRMDPGPVIAPGIHATAVIDPTAEIGEGAHVGPFVVVGPGAFIGPKARIASHVTVAEGAVIGADALIHSGVRIGARVRIGDRVVIQPGAVLGGDGFSFVTPEKSHVETARESLGTADHASAGAQSWTRIHSLGSLVIGDDVEIGANAAIDRGTVADTVIGDGTKIDNLVHIGHNCRIGRDCLLCGQVGFAGSAVLGDRVVLGGQCGVSDNIEIGSDVVAAGATKIYSNVPSGRMLMGSPAVKMDTHVEMYKALRRLPRLARTVEDLKKAVFKGDRTP
ncbi:UDP-3-O-(3-hydroxymyristoyl)glucosamine N-acyltransferase [Roseibacterium sp. SDUM158016]|uniref:UDP-3-O-(3-hydroxymyristoyl)glucosamine N-acyltransferase n=1 Tax=Roseicyclus sediminis TaxID=2980997 RepID=UPI0021D394A9|nr:UDP-3-O-(3-hydroxymyristoyl)glucosamine N-acyltransferase [Roseibacterium sp. SDUM158016]MCU4651953.1 UDP-3-O-(3-hydroxymyristoyl)glucosamine N-acyltransferase [Roseibacterium sp. SDUM158016]